MEDVTSDLKDDVSSDGREIGNCVHHDVINQIMSIARDLEAQNIHNHSCNPASDFVGDSLDERMPGRGRMENARLLQSKIYRSVQGFFVESS